MIEAKDRTAVLEKLVIAHNALAEAYLLVRDEHSNELVAATAKAYLETDVAIKWIERGI